MGKIINPANIATDVSAKATIAVTSPIEESSDKYDPYIINDPMPILNEKNAIPIALKTTLELILDISGTNIYLIPSLKPLRVAEYIAKPINIKNNPGIKSLTAFSSPPLTPWATI
tara:strand:+ start:172 stop:516 length:345 start_codon:yes stop_codon:yes gene_type:complete